MVDVAMKKIIRRIGSSVGIIFNKEEQAIHGLSKGKVVKLNLKEDKKC